MSRLFALLRTMLGALVLLPLHLVACLVPKRPDLWLFGAWLGQRYLDNPKYLFREVLAHHPGITAIWVVKCRVLAATMRSEGLPVVWAFSLKAIWLQFRAGLVVATHEVGTEFFGAAVGRSTLRVQTWHGIPMKKIGHDDLLHRGPAWRASLRRFLAPFLVDRWDLVLAAGDADRAIYASAFQVGLEKVFISGYPRNDAILRQVAARRQTPDGLFEIIYMPTFRGAPGSEFKLLGGAGFDFQGMDAFLIEQNARLTIKLHPVQTFLQSDLECIAACRRIGAIADSRDIYETIGGYDLVITDYSGIYFDFLVTSKPVILAPFDLEDYLRQDRELYYDYSELCPSDPCRNWDQVMAQIAFHREGHPPSPRYDALRNRFHLYIDDQSSARAVQRMKFLIQHRWPGKCS